MADQREATCVTVTPGGQGRKPYVVNQNTVRNSVVAADIVTRWERTLRHVWFSYVLDRADLADLSDGDEVINLARRAANAQTLRYLTGTPITTWQERADAAIAADNFGFDAEWLTV